ncbi:MAG TPA: uroporphyrinogen-III C-methyltransferase [Vicinamibacterales bacterium]|nr:uroporphyrinogen-III C-methyltransferase [Vicinamibacterales bacterium]
MTGRVSLVGAGPGDPELLTLRAIRRLEKADLVLYDALIDSDTLQFAPRARRFFVGKRAGRPAITQDAINRLMIREARRGHQVVRLKCGDPFVFGRGGEEALALAAAGIECEIVPGISSAIAAPLLAGIPVTHRGLASGFVVVSGHAESAYAPVLRSLAPASATVVVLMGMANRAAIANELLAAGWAPNTPAAVLIGISHEGEQSWHGTLDAIHSAAIEDQENLPGIIVVGAVTALAVIIAAQEREQTSARTSALLG